MPGAGFERLPSRAAVSLLDAIDYLELLAAQRPDRFDRAAIRWHGRLEDEAPTLTPAESALALAALGSMRMGDTDALPMLQRLLRRVQPTLTRRVGWRVDEASALPRSADAPPPILRGRTAEPSLDKRQW